MYAHIIPKLTITRYVEIIRETFRRDCWRTVLHMICLLPYGLFVVVLISQPDTPLGRECPLGMVLVILSGVVAPIVLSCGLFGNDISSGLFCAYFARPITMMRLYVCRVTGICLHGLIHITLATATLLLAHYLWGVGKSVNPGLCVAFTLFLFLFWTIVSATASVVLRGRLNTPAVLGYAFLSEFATIYLLHVTFRNSMAAATDTTLSWLLWFFTGLDTLIPSVTVIGLYCINSIHVDDMQLIGEITQAIVFAAVCFILGIVILARREYKA